MQVACLLKKPIPHYVVIELQSYRVHAKVAMSNEEAIIGDCYFLDDNGMLPHFMNVCLLYI